MGHQPCYNWRRFWIPHNATIRLDERGYLADPEEPLGAAYNPELVSLEALADMPCLVLLGDPGMGKSTLLHAHATEMEQQIVVAGDSHRFHNLGAFQTDALLNQKIFGSSVYQAWLGGSHQLYLFLDSLDECRLNIKTVAAWLAEELRTCPTERLRLRIACRTAEWSTELEETLKDRWQGDVGIFTLAPLRRVDVAVAAEAHGYNPQDFLDEIARVGAVPLAIKPITLDFLLRSYAHAGQHLPARQTELYAQGCLLLCDEHSRTRREAGFTGAFTVEDRLHAAERIAFLSLFANRPMIWTGPVTGIERHGTLLLGELVSALDSASLINEAVFNETLTTGLFTTRSPDEVVWSHQTYAEFLAAQYLHRQDVPLAQCMSLLVHPKDPGKQLIPQLHETAAWLAGMRVDVFRAIIQCDPEVLLRSDVARADSEDRASLVAALLELFDQKRLFDRDSRFNQRYRRLAYPQIATQLRPYILDQTKEVLVRCVAINIAEACEQQQLQDDLAKVALNPLESYQVRIEAASAVAQIGDSAIKAQLTPLAFGTAGADPDDELRGCGLRATWPEHLNAEQLFVSLQPPRHENLFGSYKLFLISHCTKHLKPTHLPTALAWAVPHATGPAFRTLNQIVDEIMALAWHHLSEPGVLAGFATVAQVRMENYAPLFRYDDMELRRDTPELQALYQSWYHDSDQRYSLFSTLLPRLMASRKEVLLLVYNQPPVVLSSDFAWLIEQLGQAQDPELQTALATIAARVLRVKDPDQLSRAYEAVQQNEYLAACLQHVFGFIRLDSKEAARLKADHQYWQGLERQREQHQIQLPPPGEIFNLLDSFEAGNMNAWWRLNRFLCFDPAGKEHHGEFKPDLRTLPGWQAADQATQARIICAAARYVCEMRDAPEQWRKKDGFSLYRPSFAGYRALLLLFFEDRDTLVQISLSAICRWIPIIVGYPGINDNTGQRAQQELIKLAYVQCPKETITEFIREISVDDRRGRGPSLWKLEHCWDEQLARALMTWLENHEPPASTLESVIGELFEHGLFPEAQVLAERLITQPIPEDEGQRERTLAVGRALMQKSPNAGWPILWPIITSDLQFGSELILSVAAYDHMVNRIGAQLSEDALADLYLWMEQQFPHHEDPQSDDDTVEFYEDTPRNEVAQWRDQLPQILKHKGTAAAIRAIQRIVAALPDIHWLHWMLLEAQAIARRETWTPHPPAELLALTQNRDGRLVDSGEQLLDVIIESLQRLEQELQGETPGAIDLWNESSERPVTYRPRDENRLSDYVKRHLQRDLCERNIVINREVEIQRGGGGTPGERTDIKVDVIRKGTAKNNHDHITVIIETKGCWNRQLQEAIKSQLHNRYLREHRSNFGLYLVGWFNCTAWDDNDYRKAAALQMDRPSAKLRFEQLAAENTGSHVMIRAFVLNTALPDVVPSTSEPKPKGTC
ncbi:NACHT domain-containing NTPase [Candidatus Chloroploca sp. Khr17]|uniref:NACHT domain-containing protein n=1 Tax=Candidatus Chloroploca sp. Khr17 TaxID=2496869 RepID=UPI00101DD662|nr:hypothetical protein [Candidatus Chloroploca sp. Khr17]